MSAANEGVPVKTMAEVIRDHQPTTGMSVASGVTCQCGYWTGSERPGIDRPAGFGSGLIWHQSQELSAAGFGPVQEAAAAGVRSVFDIWAGGGGRRTVRMQELDDAARTILAGEWDDHIKWNMGDIRREQERRARAAARQPAS